MAKLGGKYETIFVVDSTLTDEATAAIVEKFKTLWSRMRPWVK